MLKLGSLAMNGSALPDRALKVHECWGELIVSGLKDWEIRSSHTNVRGRIGIMATGKSERQLLGEATLCDCFELTREDDGTGRPHIDDHYFNHRLPDMSADAVIASYERVFAWRLVEPVKYNPPVTIKNRQGCVTWIMINRPAKPRERNQKAGERNRPARKVL